jgi:hypothetical protein
MGNWQIVEQEETVGKNVFFTNCKLLKAFPIKKNEEIYFGKLKFPLFQVVINNEKGVSLRIRLNAYHGLHKPKFTIMHPDRVDYKEIFVGEGKKRRRIPDLLSPKVRIAGEKEHFDSVEQLSERLRQLTTEKIVQDILSAFAERVSQYVSKKKAA